ncbi:MAG: hypothetical protein DI551_00635 [Micavibrio aeruginosavorus]|uniref:Uncharacterized protein n=1 Tax=Micavibrio aeruginosavorus TaxID=349221 RepID=A0A2W5QBT1_9BACT|nr:MAG: hypothetical protein DI551_00635 [Micavibrio aeruginosavorus]
MTATENIRIRALELAIAATSAPRRDDDIVLATAATFEAYLRDGSLTSLKAALAQVQSGRAAHRDDKTPACSLPPTSQSFLSEKEELSGESAKAVNAAAEARHA